MRFTVDVENQLFEFFRLAASGSFRVMKGGFRLEGGDATFSTAQEAYRRIAQLPKALQLGGKTVPVAQPYEARTLGDVLADPIVRVHRDAIPPAPSLVDVRSAIAFGDNRKPTCLIVTLDGRVQLVSFEGDIVSRPTHAVRMESFTAFDMTGAEAANDNQHVQTSLDLLLAGWLTHLITGELGVYSDYCEDTEAKLRAKLDEIAAKGYSPTR